MKVGDEVEVHYTPGTGYGMHEKGRFEGCKGRVTSLPSPRTSCVKLEAGLIINFWNVDLRPAVALTPFEQRVRSYIDKELRT